MGKQDIIHSPDGVHTEVFKEPSKEMILLVRLLGGLIAPRDGKPSRFNRVFGAVVIAPFTQFTFTNFALQDYLFRVFHVKIWSRLAHAIFMPCVVFFNMVFLAQFRVHGLPAEPGWHQLVFNGAYAYGIFLLFWYLVLAISEKFYLWWLLTLPVVVALAFGADFYFCHYLASANDFHWYAPTDLLHNPLLWTTVSAIMLSLSHAPELVLPPRAAKRWSWMLISEAIFGKPSERITLATLLRGARQIAFQLTLGPINEWWAAPRLMPYNWLMWMFAAGYKPEVNKVQQEYADRALASGNPAVDYIGIGGGAYLRGDIGKS